MRAGITVLVLVVVLLSLQNSDAYCYRGKLKPCGRGGWFYMSKNKCFKVFTQRKNFRQAERSCRRFQGHLVSIHSYYENQRVMCQIRKFRSLRMAPLWIGLVKRRVNSYRWIDGSRSKYRAWFSRWRKHDRGCVAINTRGGSLWGDDHCRFRKSFVCEKLACHF